MLIMFAQRNTSGDRHHNSSIFNVGRLMTVNTAKFC